MNLQSHAQRFVGQPIVAHHVDGTVHRGILHSVTNDGMYIRYGAGYASGKHHEGSFDSAVIRNGSEENDVEPAFFGGFGFLPWLALAGFWGGGLWW